MDAGRLSICGEESFGTGSDHIREKDGIWAIVAWLNILAAANLKSPHELVGINDILLDHYKKYGRSFFSRYDYEEVDSDAAGKLVAALNEHIANETLIGKSFSASTGETFTVHETLNFDYTDPIDHSVSKNQGQIVRFSDGSRVVFRLSGTGSQGATVRLYIEKYTKDAGQYSQPTAEGLKGLIEVALEISRLKEFLSREKPTVITVSITHPFSFPFLILDFIITSKSLSRKRRMRPSRKTHLYSRIVAYLVCASMPVRPMK